MIKRIVWQWEDLDEFTRRAKVMGGWIVRSEYLEVQKKLCAVSSVFIHDPYHEWQIIPPFVEEKVERANIAKEFAA